MFCKKYSSYHLLDHPWQLLPAFNTEKDGSFIMFTAILKDVKMTGFLLKYKTFLFVYFRKYLFEFQENSFRKYTRFSKKTCSTGFLISGKNYFHKKLLNYFSTLGGIFQTTKFVVSPLCFSCVPESANSWMFFMSMFSFRSSLSFTRTALKGKNWR